METSLAIAERALFAIDPDGSEHSIVIRVEQPTLIAQADWGTYVTLLGLDSKRHLIGGIDSWQSLHLAMKFPEHLLPGYIEKGWKFFWDRGGTEFKPSDLFDSLRAP